jgi:hypothetical protein
MAAVTVTLEVTVGEPVTGLWCGSCLLPSLIAVPVTETLGNRQPSLAAYKACADCGRFWREEY